MTQDEFYCCNAVPSDQIMIGCDIVEGDIRFVVDTQDHEIPIYITIEDAVRMRKQLKRLINEAKRG